MTPQRYARQGSPVDFLVRHWRALLAALLAVVPAVWVGVGLAHEKLQALERIPVLEERIARSEVAQRELLLQQRLTQQQLDLMQKRAEGDTAAILSKLERVLEQRR